jgi:hypothetical protein
MDIEKLKEALKPHKVKVGFMKKGLYKLLAPQIPDDVEIVDAGEGLDQKSANSIPVIVTPDNVYLIKYKGALGGIDSAVIKRDSITSTSVSGGLLATLTISTAGQVYEIERMGIDVANRLSGLLQQ